MAAKTTIKVANLTTAALNDSFTAAQTGLTEDNLFANLNVLANDPGSAQLYSVVQDTSSYAATAQFPVSNTATLASGAKITINGDGTIKYDASHLNVSPDSLAEGEVFKDSFTYTVRMANGALSTAVATVEIAGENDAPTLASVAPVSTISDTNIDDTPAAITGTLVGHDVDHGAVLTYSLVGGVAHTDYGTITLDSATGKYSFLADPDKIDALHDGENQTVSFSVQVTDEHGAASAAQTLSFQLVGANDTASIAGDTAAQVGEDDDVSVGGKLTVSDLDHDEAHATVVAATETADHAGKYSVDANGNWKFEVNNDAVQHLAKGVELTETFTVTSLDGTAHQDVAVTIVGDNDLAGISGYTGPASVAEDAASIGGTLTVKDVDDGEAHTTAIAQTATQDGAGQYSVDADGNWSFAVNHDAVQHLSATETLTEKFTVASLDGTATQEVEVTIQGDNDLASISGNAAGTVNEDGTLSTGGKLSVTDVDDGEHAFAGVADSALHGTYGNFTFNAATGDWGYDLRNGDANVQALTSADRKTDTLLVHSLDGTADQTISVAINGADEPVVTPTVPHYDIPAPSATTTTLTGDNGANTITGTSGNDLIDGGNGADTLSGGAGSDTIFGGSGADKITGGSGSDTLDGGNGAKDTFYFTATTDATDVINNFEVGTDKLDFAAPITSGGATYQIVGVDTGNDGVADSSLVQVDSNGAAAGGTVTDMVVVVGVQITSADVVWHA